MLLIFYHQYIIIFFTKHVLPDIMVFSVSQSVLDIVKIARLVITPVVCVTMDVTMVGLDQTVPKVVRIFILSKHCL